MSRQFVNAYQHLIGIEGGEVNDPDDSGGHTKYGITEHVARANGYLGSMSDLPLDLATGIAKTQYWDIISLDDIAERSIRLAEEMFESGYVAGVGVPARFLQRLLNVFNNRGRYWEDIVVDGLIGPVTLRALDKYYDLRGVEGDRILVSAMNNLQSARFIDLAERREKDEKFIYGWLKNRI